MEKQYVRFFAMILTSTVIMFGMMYLNVFQLDHIFYSQTRVYMALMMGAAMAIIMLLFMWKMYQNKKANLAILIGSVIVFGLSLGAVRTQANIQDVAWLKAMIPHHSIAILTSKKADLKDPRVQELAQKIIQTQEKEITEMKRLIKDLRAK
ncbi:DUF305 domain-containing protein [Enterococcus faecalis]